MNEILNLISNHGNVKYNEVNKDKIIDQKLKEMTQENVKLVQEKLNMVKEVSDMKLGLQQSKQDSKYF